MNVNYHREMERTISSIKKTGEKPKLLMHSCCAPCSSACIERVKDYFDLVIYYYNPNIDGVEEYQKREAEQERLCTALGVGFIGSKYDKNQFLSKVSGLENEKEGGARCSVCYELRLEETAKKAVELGCDYFTTTLTVSPLKDAERLNSIGFKLAEKYGVKFLPSDFKKKGGYLRSIELSREYGLYRQNYCGCEFSKNFNP
ncbi:MAG: epoxyqueuosine reductase QueH [Clostridia bacterium]|nr:epoxyqueuosine reductase QueH [Clostridia bacterium]